MMFFDWSLAQDEWSDEQKNVWQNINKMWHNFDYTNWNMIQNGQEWKDFANQSVISIFNNLATDAIRVKEWQLIKLFMVMFPDVDVYSHNFNKNRAKIVFGRKEQNQTAERVWFIIERKHQYRKIRISSYITGKNTEILEIKLDNLQNTPNTIIEVLRKPNHSNNNQTYGYTLTQELQKYPIPETRKRNLPIQYMSSKKCWTWDIINEELKGCNTWQDITTSTVWKEGFANTVADDVFRRIADDDTRFKVWGIMCEISTKYHLDIFYHNSTKKIAVGRKDLNKTHAETTPFTITSSLFHKGDNKNDTDGNQVLNGTIKFEQIANSISLQNWLEDTNSDFPKDLSVINTRPTKTIYLPSDFGNNTDESDSERSNSPTNLPTHPLNVIFYGPPGTGKTYTTIERAMRICEGSDFDDKISREDLVEQYQEYIEDERIVFTTFHQSYSYEDFIEGIRATTENNNINYKVQDGVFKELCKNAAQWPDENFVIIIDEINRGNISRVFGELITLIEDSKRTGKLEEISVKLPYSRESFSVPQNVYIIGTMNTADRSLAGLDLALRRRFTFEEMRPKTELLKGIKVEGIKIDELLSIMNQRIEVLLDREHTIGHAYFMELKNDSPIEKLAEIFQNKILPLLQEYFFDDWEKINSVLGENGFISKRDVNKRLFKVKNSTDEKNKDESSQDENTIWQINTGAFAEKQKYIDIYQIA